MPLQPLQPPRRDDAPVLRTKDDILMHLSEVIDSGDPKQLIATLSDIAVAARALPHKPARQLTAEEANP
jgi:hypothetical protein